MPNQKLLNQTHITEHDTQNHGVQWYWTTTANNGAIIGVGGEGYSNLRDAINGFFSQQGIPDWEPPYEGAEYAIPENYTLEKTSEDHYVISHYSGEDVQNDTSN